MPGYSSPQHLQDRGPAAIDPALLPPSGAAPSHGPAPVNAPEGGTSIRGWRKLLALAAALAYLLALAGLSLAGVAESVVTNLGLYGWLTVVGYMGGNVGAAMAAAKGR